MPVEQDEGMPSQPELQYIYQSPSTLTRHNARQQTWLSRHGNYEHDIEHGDTKTEHQNVNSSCVGVSAEVEPTLSALARFHDDV